MIYPIVILRKTLSTEAKPRLTMSFSKDNNLIYHPLNYTLFNLLYWIFSLSRLQWCFFFHFNVFFNLMVFYFILMFQLIHNHQIEVLNERVTVKKIVTRWAMCQSRMLPSSYPIKIQLTYMKYNKTKIIKQK